MHQVTINGVQYAPVCNSVPHIGIAITTHNRADVLVQTWEKNNSADPYLFY